MPQLQVPITPSFLATPAYVCVRVCSCVLSAPQVKFNRKGIAAFRIISMDDSSSAENTVLNWRPAEKEGFSAKLLRLGKSEGIDLKNLKVL